MSRWKRFFFFPLCLVLLTAQCVQAFAVTYTPDMEVDALGYYLYNIDNRELVAERDMDKRLYPASLTKIMTCILAMENTPDLDNTILTYPTSVQDFLYNYQYVEGNGAVSLGGMLAGEELSMRQLLYAMMLPSANEAAMTVAEYIGGSQEGFVAMMNQRAGELGLTNTNFVNCNGLFNENHYSSPHDMAILALHAMELDGFMDIVSTASYDTGPTNKHDNLTWETTIKMQHPKSQFYYAGLRGIKSGTLPESGSCLVSSCTRDGFTYLLVVMGAPYYDDEGNVLAEPGSYKDTRELYDWVFDSFKRKALVDKGSYEHEIKINLSLDQDVLKLMTGERFSALVPEDTEISDVNKVPEVPDSIDAPVQKGDAVGELRLILAGEEIGRVPLLAAETVEASTVLVIGKKIGEFFSSFWFKFLFILLLILFIAYIALMILRNRNRRRRSGYRPKRRI